MKKLLWKRKKGFIQYLLASFLLNIERFVQMGIFTLVLGVVERGINTNYRWVVILIALCCLYSALSFIISKLLQIGFMRDTILDVRKQAFDKIMRMSFKQFSKKSREVYISNMINDINTFESKFFVSLLNFLINTGMFVLCFICLLILEPVLAAIMTTVSVILYLISLSFAAKTVKLQEEVSTENEEFTTRMGNTFHGLEILKLNRIEDKFEHKSILAMRRLENRKTLFQIFSEGQRSIISILAYVTTCGIMVYLCLKFQNGMSMAEATFVYQIASNMSFNLIDAFPLWNTIKSSSNIYKKITAEEENGQNEGVLQSKGFSSADRIQAEHLSFSYENKKIITDASFTIERGKKYLIKGASGAGKSTLMNLLAKTCDSYEGSILADGVEYREIRDKEFHDRVAFIYQDVFLFEDTIKNNITLYKDIPEERIDYAVRACDIDSFIKDKKLGLEEILSENGKNLSGGQRQRISIARAIAKDAEIVFVDEGTSSLNEELGREIEKVFLSLSQTVIAISHRYYEGVSNRYDYVLEIKNGEVTQYNAADYFEEAVTC